MRGDPEKEMKTWLERLAEVDQERRGYLRLAAKGHMTDDELDEILAELEDTREAAEKELQSIRARREVLVGAGAGQGRTAGILRPDDAGGD